MNSETLDFGPTVGTIFDTERKAPLVQAILHSNDVARSVFILYTPYSRQRPVGDATKFVHTSGIDTTGVRNE